MGSSGGGGTSYRMDPSDLRMFPPEIQRYLYDTERFIRGIDPTSIPFIVIGILLMIGLLILLTYVLRMIGRLGLIIGTSKAEDGESGYKFSGLIQESKPFFWRILGMNLLIEMLLFTAIFTIVFVAVGIAVLSFGFGIIFLIPVICLLVPIGWVIGILIEQANVALILEDLSIINALRRGWEVFQANPGNLIIIGFILLLINLVGGILLFIPMFIVAGPVIFASVSNLILGAKTLSLAGIVLPVILFILYTPVFLLASGIIQAYIKSTWALTYLQVTGENINSNRIVESGAKS